jgi:hypothetical protein
MILRRWFSRVWLRRVAHRESIPWLPYGVNRKGRGSFRSCGTPGRLVRRFKVHRTGRLAPSRQIAVYRFQRGTLRPPVPLFAPPWELEEIAVYFAWKYLPRESCGSSMF